MKRNEEIDGIRQELRKRYPASVAGSTELLGAINDVVTDRRDRDDPGAFFRMIDLANSLNEKLALTSLDDNDWSQEGSPAWHPPRGFKEVMTESDWAKLGYLAKMSSADAAKRPEVFGFRQAFFDNNLLSPEEYEAFLSSPALGLLSLEDLKEHGVSDLRTPSEAGNDKSMSDDVMGSFWLKIPRLGLEITKTIPHAAWQKCYFSPQRVGISVFAGSVLHEFEQVAALLEKNYHWSLTSAKLFLATGKEAHPCLSCSSHSISLMTGHAFPSLMPLDAVITLQVPFWFTTEQVAGIYRDMSAGAKGQYDNETGTIKRGGGRKKGVKALDLLTFVDTEKLKRNILGDGTLSQRSEIYEAWKAVNGDGWKNLSRFMEAYKRAKLRPDRKGL